MKSNINDFRRITSKSLYFQFPKRIITSTYEQANGVHLLFILISFKFLSAQSQDASAVKKSLPSDIYFSDPAISPDGIAVTRQPGEGNAKDSQLDAAVKELMLQLDNRKPGRSKRYA